MLLSPDENDVAGIVREARTIVVCDDTTRGRAPNEASEHSDDLMALQ